MTVKLDFCDEHVSYLVTNCLSSILKVNDTTASVFLHIV